MPPPDQVVQTIDRVFAKQGLAGDVMMSILRVLMAFAMAGAAAVPLGPFPVIDAELSPFVLVWRDLPALSLIPILLMWFGTGKARKLALPLLGMIFVLITPIADQTKDVHKQLIDTALTLGASQSVR